MIALFCFGAVSASENMTEDVIEDLADTAADDLQNDVENTELLGIVDDSASESDEVYDDACNVNASADILSPDSVSQSEDVLGVNLKKSDVWFHEMVINDDETNMWILNYDRKAFPEGSSIKIVAKEKGSSYKSSDVIPVEDLYDEMGFENIHYFIYLKDFSKIQLKAGKKYLLKVYYVSPEGKTHLINKKVRKVKWTKSRYVRTCGGKFYFFAKDVKTHPYGKDKIRIILYKKNGNFLANTDVKVSIGGQTKTLKTNSRGLITLNAPEKTGKYRITFNVLKGQFDVKVKVGHSVKIPKLKIKKSAKKLVIPLQLKKINGKNVKNQKITFKFNNKVYKVKTNKKGIAKVTVKKSVLKKLKVGKIKLQATYLNDTATRTVKVKK